jgi:hypothetical protein
MSATLGVSNPRFDNIEEDQYPDLLGTVQANFNRLMIDPTARLFTTNVTKSLYFDFLDALPLARRQHYNCRCCETFTREFGGLVTIDASGQTIPVLWSGQYPSFFKEAIARMNKLVKAAQVTGIFLSADLVWGQPQNGPWTHLSITPPSRMLYKGIVKTADQMMAERREDFRTMRTALRELPLDAIQQAVPLLEGNALARSEVLLDRAKWFRDVHLACAEAPKTRRDNLLWRAVALAPAGFCHPRSGMLGVLLEDIISGMDFAQVKRRFDKNMDPLLKSRPQAAPTKGNIARAEGIIEKLNASGALARRYARLDEIEALWRPAAPKIERVVKEAGVFSHLVPKNTSSKTGPSSTMPVPPVTMTFVKFRETVLPTAQSMMIQLPLNAWNYTALVTAEHAEAPPIIQWDREDMRNPFSWYLYPTRSMPNQWRLRGGRKIKVNAVTLLPPMWHGNEDGKMHSHQGRAVIFVLDGARDTVNPSLALFPEILRSELHEVRATIEQFSRQGKLGGEAEASACGVMFRNEAGWGSVEVTNSFGTTTVYHLDRWD